jgi:hypothetical protein
VESARGVAAWSSAIVVSETAVAEWAKSGETSGAEPTDQRINAG